MSPGGRNLVHADGRPAVLAGDTAWGLPWRATHAQCAVYAADRQAKGFNAVLLMSVQPDMGARGPSDRMPTRASMSVLRTCPTATSTQLNPAYFQYLDVCCRSWLSMRSCLCSSRSFMVLDGRGCAQQGLWCHRPSMRATAATWWRVTAHGRRFIWWAATVRAASRRLRPAVKRWSSGTRIRQPTGIHYRPHIVIDAHQDAAWLDFQWCQTGHSGEHMPERVADMWRNLPPRGLRMASRLMNRAARPGGAIGWWQGHEAWSNLCAGGTMGVVYGAGSLWQWGASRR